MRPTRAVIPIAALLAVVTLTGFCQVVSADDGPFGPIHVASNRSRYSGGGCPIEVIFTASINFVMHTRRASSSTTTGSAVMAPRLRSRSYVPRRASGRW